MNSFKNRMRLCRTNVLVLHGERVERVLDHRLVLLDLLAEECERPGTSSRRRNSRNAWRPLRGECSRGRRSCRRPLLAPRVMICSHPWIGRSLSKTINGRLRLRHRRHPRLRSARSLRLLGLPLIKTSSLPSLVERSDALALTFGVVEVLALALARHAFSSFTLSLALLALDKLPAAFGSARRSLVTIALAHVAART